MISSISTFAINVMLELPSTFQLAKFMHIHYYICILHENLTKQFINLLQMGRVKRGKKR
jgi:hypothetical protein